MERTHTHIHTHTHTHTPGGLCTCRKCGSVSDCTIGSAERSPYWLHVCVCVCVCVCVRARETDRERESVCVSVCVCVHTCVRACVRAYACTCVRAAHLADNTQRARARARARESVCVYVRAHTHKTHTLAPELGTLGTLTSTTRLARLPQKNTFYSKRTHSIVRWAHRLEPHVLHVCHRF